MCGRYVNISKLSEIEKRFKVKAKKGQKNEPNPNVSLGEYAPVITQETNKELNYFQFGFCPHWAQKRNYVINARGEGNFNLENNPEYMGSQGIFEKPMFQKSIKGKRCLVVADAFIEGPEISGLDHPFLIYKKDKRRPFAIAGIWDEWLDENTGEYIRSFAIVTTVSNPLLQKIKHHRSPVVLNRDAEAIWLNPNSSEEEISQLIQPFNSVDFNAYPISPLIKSPKAKEMNLLMPTGPRLYKNHSYEIYSDIKTELNMSAINPPNLGIQQSLF